MSETAPPLKGLNETREVRLLFERKKVQNIPVKHVAVQLEGFVERGLYYIELFAILITENEISAIGLLKLQFFS